MDKIDPIFIKKTKQKSGFFTHLLLCITGIFANIDESLPNFFAIWIRKLILFFYDTGIQPIVEFKNSSAKNYPIFLKIP